jgi:hypothetical protein
MTLYLSVTPNRKGEIIFRSDNMSTISVLKEVLSKDAAQKTIAIKMTHGEHKFVWVCIKWICMPCRAE